MVVFLFGFVLFVFIFKSTRYEINDNPILDWFDKELLIPSIFFDL